jgi:H+-translocating NAD(P) transhydrogenase subunit alpha
LLVTAAAVAGMKPGSIIVDMAASDLGGNVELSKPAETIVTKNGVTIIAPENLPATMPGGSSAFYARNISALLLGMVKDGELNLDFEDEVTKATVIAHDGAVVAEPVKKLLDPAPAANTAPEPAPAAAAAPPAPPPPPVTAETPPSTPDAPGGNA